MTSRKQYIIFFIILCLIGVSLRLLTLYIPLYDDAAAIPVIEKYHDSHYINVLVGTHGPLNYFFFFIGSKIFGISTVGIRSTLFVLSIAYLIILYLFTKKVFGQKTAMYAVLLNLFTFYAFYNYFIAEGDGVIQSIFSTLIFFTLYLGLNNKENIKKKWMWIILSIFCFVFLVTMKHRAALLIIPLFLYILSNTKKIVTTLLYCTSYCSIALFFLILHIPLFYAFYGNMAPTLLQLILSHNSLHITIIDKILHPSIFFTTFIALTPLLILLPLTTFKMWKKDYSLFFCWMSLIPVYILLIPYNFPYVKYLAGFLLPPLTILSAEALSQERLKKTTTVWIALCTVFLSLILIYVNNTIPLNYWFFVEAMGPIVKIWQPFIYGIFLLSILLYFFIWFNIKSKYKLLVLSIFLILNFSFNILMITDPIIDQTHSLMIQEVQKYTAAHNGQLGIVYAWNEDIAYYVGNIGFYIRTENDPFLGIERYNQSTLREYSLLTGMGQQGYVDLDNSLESLTPYILDKGGTIFLLNFPFKYVVDASATNQEKIAFFEKHCTKEKDVEYKTAELLIFSCNGSSISSIN